MSDTDAWGTEHTIEVTSVQEYTTYLDPSYIEDGELVPFDFDFSGERKRTFKCSCGRRFLKESTAAEHLRDVGTEGSTDE